jgi:hypothetical protein
MKRVAKNQTPPRIMPYPGGRDSSLSSASEYPPSALVGASDRRLSPAAQNDEYVRGLG